MELWQVGCKVRCRVSGISAFYLGTGHYLAGGGGGGGLLILGGRVTIF